MVAQQYCLNTGFIARLISPAAGKMMVAKPLGLYVSFQVMDVLRCIVQTSGSIQTVLGILSAALGHLFPAEVVLNL